MTEKELLKSIIEDFQLEKFDRFFKKKSIYFKKKIDFSELDNYGFDKFNNGLIHGTIELSKSASLLIASYKANQPLTDRSGKREQYELAKKVLKSDMSFDAGIFIFYDSNGNFRFSLINAYYEKNEKGIKQRFNSFKRYTYFVNKNQTNKTFIEQIADADFSSIEKLVAAFSVTKVTKEFYRELSNWYHYSLDKVNFPADLDELKDETVRNPINLIRLLTRIIFVWFLKEKHLIPDLIFDENCLKDVVKDFNKSKSSYYYNAILQNLFFGTLNRTIGDRKFAQKNDFLTNRVTYDVKNLYRYSDFLNIPEEKFIELFKEVPFLNGGLFDCLDREKIYVDGFTRNDKKRAVIPDLLFFSNERTVDLTTYSFKKDEVFKGLINILKDYNFTIDENSPIDEEVALDPELLGMVFENLLASYNPETRESARKGTGSYYTPREIVSYMVDESLVAYFKERLKDISEDNIRHIISYNEEPLDLDIDKRNNIVKEINNLKILDPACGSGAFPMGMLHKLVYILQKIDPDNELWYELQCNKALEETERAFKDIKDKSEREILLKEINEIFDESINYPDYARKLYLIENSIYGVDIQPIAVQISKLRFFISLVIDQKVDDNKENRGILSLPNLETKFVTANTLISLPLSQKTIADYLSDNDGNIEKVKDDIKTIRKKYFSIKNRNEKVKLNKEYEKLRQDLEELLSTSDYEHETAHKIAQFSFFDQNKSADWFDPEWMFDISDGFNIVISNPPYVSTKGISENDKQLLKKQYGFSDDLYNHFYFKGMELLSENGVLSYISSKTFWTIQTKKNLRELILKNQLLILFDTANPFDAPMVDTCVILIQKKSKPLENYSFLFLDGTQNISQPAIQVGNIEYYKNAPNKVFFPINDRNIKIYNRYGKKINELLNNWWDKISTSKNIEKYKKDLEEYRKSLKPGDITLLGLITEGGQGLATGNNGKYVGVLQGTKWAEHVKKQRPEKLLLAVEFCKSRQINNKDDADKFLSNLSEEDIRNLFDNLKEKYGRDIFGQGWLYRIVHPNEIADIEKLADEEKLNGICGQKTYVPYDKGDKDGNRWYAPTPYYIDWCKENVKTLQKDPKARWQGYQFYFREGFCWTDVNSTYLKSRIKDIGIYDVLTMSLFGIINIPDWYYVCIINSKFISEYVDEFINSTSHFQINDARQLPIIIPTTEQLQFFEQIFNNAVSIQKDKFSGKISEEEANNKLNEIQKKLDEFVESMYLQ